MASTPLSARRSTTFSAGTSLTTKLSTGIAASGLPMTMISGSDRSDDQQIVEQPLHVGRRGLHRDREPLAARSGGRLVKGGQVIDARDETRKQRVLVCADLQPGNPGRVRVERDRAERADHVGVAEDERADGRPAPCERIHRHHVRVDLVDVDEAIGRGRRVVDDDEAAVDMHQLGGRPQIGHGAKRRRGRGDGDQPGRAR